MSRTLSPARAAFIEAIHRDTSPTERPRLVAVLDALIKWSVARPDLLVFRTDEGATPVMSFERVGTKVTFWSARVTRAEGAKLEIYPPSGNSLTPAARAQVMETLNANSRVILAPGDRLRIGFAALKNVAGRTAVLEMMDQLLTGSLEPAQPTA